MAGMITYGPDSASDTSGQDAPSQMHPTGVKQQDGLEVVSVRLHRVRDQPDDDLHRLDVVPGRLLADEVDVGRASRPQPNRLPCLEREGVAKDDLGHRWLQVWLVADHSDVRQAAPPFAAAYLLRHTLFFQAPSG